MKITELLEQYNIPIAPTGHHHGRPGWVQIDCPFCGEESHSWHMGYSLEGRYFNCWKCGYHTAAQVISKLTGLSITKSTRLLYKLEIVEEKIAVKTTGQYKPPQGVRDLMRIHKQYLDSRGFHWPTLIKFWNIRGIGVSRDLPWRIFIPIYYRGKPVSWTARALSDSDGVLRYKSAAPEEEFVEHKTILYGSDYARVSTIVVEGPTSVWRLGLGATATFGTDFTQAQVKQIAKFQIRAICFDNEPIAQQQAKKLCNLLSPLPGETYNICLDCKDPAIAPNGDILKLRRRFLNYS